MYCSIRDDGTVRPLAGAGIEIVLVAPGSLNCMFAPSRGRELKCNVGRGYIQDGDVRPLAGAGIEIGRRRDRAQFPVVRPLAGAGIEILIRENMGDDAAGSPPRGGGN